MPWGHAGVCGPLAQDFSTFCSRLFHLLRLFGACRDAGGLSAPVCPILSRRIAGTAELLLLVSNRQPSRSHVRVTCSHPWDAGPRCSAAFRTATWLETPKTDTAQPPQPPCKLMQSAANLAPKSTSTLSGISLPVPRRVQHRLLYDVAFGQAAT